MGADLLESKRGRSIEKGEKDDMSMRERRSREYNGLEETGSDDLRESAKHTSKDRSRTSVHKDEKEHRSKDQERLKAFGSRGKDYKDYEKNRDRRRDDKDDREKDRVREKDSDREKHRDRERDRELKDREKQKDRERERDKKVDTEKERDKERGKEKSSRDKDKDREDKDRARDRDREKRRDREREREIGRDRGKDATDREKGKERVKEKEDQADNARDKIRDNDRNAHKLKDEEYARRKDMDIDGSPRLEARFAKDQFDESDDKDEPEILKERSDMVGSGAHLSESQLEERISRMRQERIAKSSEGAKSTDGASEILAWVNRNRKLEEKRKAEEKAIQLSKMFEEQDNMNEEMSDDEAVAEHAARDLGGVKILHGLDKVLEGGAVVLTLKDQSILADGDINQEVDMLENVEIGEQKRRNEAYKAAKKKTGLYDDKFSDEPGTERKILPQYDDPVADEGVTLDSSGRFTGEAERKLEELRRRIQGIPASSLGEDLSSTAKISTDYYTQEEITKFKKPKKKKSLRKKEKLDIDSLEAEAISAGLGSADLGSRHDERRQKMREEQERIDAEMRKNAYQSAMAKAEEASNALRLEQVPTTETEEETSVFGDDDEELRKSLERARKIALKKQDEAEKSGLQAISFLSASANNDSAVNNTIEEQENKIVFAEVEEFVWGHQLNDDDEPKAVNEDVFMDEDIEPDTSDNEMSVEDSGKTQLKEIAEDKSPSNEEENEAVPDETLHEAPVGKGLAGALNLLKDRGALKETVEWGGRNMDKKKSKLVGVYEGDGRKEIRIERTDEYGRILTPKEAFRQLSHRFHGKGPGKMKQEKRMRQYQDELKIKQMKNADTPSLSVERMRETQAKLKTPYLVLSGHSKPGQDGENGSGFVTMEKDLGGGLTPMLGDKKVEHFLNIKRKSEAGDLGSQKKPKT